MGVEKGGTDSRSAVKIVEIFENNVNKKNSESKISRGNFHSPSIASAGSLGGRLIL